MNCYYHSQCAACYMPRDILAQCFRYFARLLNITVCVIQLAPCLVPCYVLCSFISLYVKVPECEHMIRLNEEYAWLHWITRHLVGSLRINFILAVNAYKRAYVLWIPRASLVVAATTMRCYNLSQYITYHTFSDKLAQGFIYLCILLNIARCDIQTATCLVLCCASYSCVSLFVRSPGCWYYKCYSISSISDSCRLLWYLWIPVLRIVCLWSDSVFFEKQYERYNTIECINICSLSFHECRNE